MTTFGNIFLGIATILFFALFNLIFLKSQPRGGDYAVGYAWSLILGVLAFSVCLTIAVIITGMQGGLVWVVGEYRKIVIMTGFLLILIGNGFFILMSGENPADLPLLIRKLFRYLPAVLPPLLILATGILLNGDRMSVPVALYKGPVFLGLAAGGIAILFLLIQEARQSADRLRGQADFNNKIILDHLNQIDTTDVSKDMVFLLIFTDANHPSEVRTKALAKIKSRPDWQEELVRRLQNDWAPQVFIFLASNDVDDKSLFPEAVRQGVLIQARLIRDDIRNCRNSYDLYEGRFSWEVERVLRTVDHFMGMGVDFGPAVRELRQAFDEPTDFEKPKLPAKKTLEKWLKVYGS